MVIVIDMNIPSLGSDIVVLIDCCCCGCVYRRLLKRNRRINEVEQTQAGSGDAAFYRNYTMRLIISWCMGYLLVKEIQLIDIGRLTTV